MHQRTKELLLVVALLGTPAVGRAGTCQWADMQGWPSLRQQDRLVELRREVVCSADAAGTLTAKLSTLGPSARELKTVSLTVEAKGKWQRTMKLQDKLFPYGTNAYCEEKPGFKPSKLTTRLDDGELKPAYPVRLRLEVTGTGDLAGLRLSEELEAFCLACPRAGAGINLYDGRAMSGAIKAGARFRSEIDRAAWDCLSTDATLEVRYFLGASHQEAEKRIRPDLVQAHLERAFKIGRDKATLELDPPLKELCRIGGEKVVVEFGGRGQLRVFGSRLHLDLKCK